MEVRQGTSRVVLLLGGSAIKMPSLRHGVRFFVKGMLANLQEAYWWRETSQHHSYTYYICPVMACGPFGLWLVMPRCRPLKRKRKDYVVSNLVGFDDKPENFGVTREGCVVLLDYGDCGFGVI